MSDWTFRGILRQMWEDRFLPAMVGFGALMGSLSGVGTRSWEVGLLTAAVPPGITLIMAAALRVATWYELDRRGESPIIEDHP